MKSPSAFFYCGLPSPCYFASDPVWHRRMPVAAGFRAPAEARTLSIVSRASPALMVPCRRGQTSAMKILAVTNMIVPEIDEAGRRALLEAAGPGAEMTWCVLLRRSRHQRTMRGWPQREHVRS